MRCIKNMRLRRLLDTQINIGPMRNNWNEFEPGITEKLCSTRYQGGRGVRRMRGRDQEEFVKKLNLE